MGISNMFDVIWTAISQHFFNSASNKPIPTPTLFDFIFDQTLVSKRFELPAALIVFKGTGYFFIFHRQTLISAYPVARPFPARIGPQS